MVQTIVVFWLVPNGSERSYENTSLHDEPNNNSYDIGSYIILDQGVAYSRHQALK